MNSLRSVAGIAIEKGLFFIARRIPGGDLGGKWEFPGGKVEEGESDGEALAREFLEEFAVPIETGSFLGNASFEHHGRLHTVNAYTISFKSYDFKLSFHTEWRWAALEEIEKLDFAGSDLSLLPSLQKSLMVKG